MIDQRVRRLAKTFQIVALAVGSPLAILECSSSSDAPLDGGVDASLSGRDTGAASPGSDSASPTPDSASGDTSTVSTPDGASNDAAEEPDVPPVFCTGTVDAIDGSADAPDGDPLCVVTLNCPLSVYGYGVADNCVVLQTYGGEGGLLDAALTLFPYCQLAEGQGCTDGSFEQPDGDTVFVCTGCPGGAGRRPAGWASRRCVSAADARGAYFAEAARLEGASIRAFVELGRALAAHGAPAALVDATRTSARDEIRHARAMTKLARRFGATPGHNPRSRRIARIPSLATIARENAIEGCVRETYSALLNAWQAARACDPEVRAAMAALATDELRHAALSWEIAEWASSRLDARARRSVARAQRRAAGKLVADAVANVPAAGVRAGLGLPDAREAAALAQGLFERLWG